MGSDSVREYVAGWVEFRARGLHPQRLVNLACTRGISIWGIRAHGQTLIARVRPGQFRALRPLARTAGVRLRILARGGLPFSIKSWRQRRMLALGLVCTLCVFVYLSTFVWFVEVTGNDILPDEALLFVAGEHGLRPGVQRSQVDVGLVRRGLVLDHDLVAWASVNLRGTRAVIQIVERTPELIHAWLRAPGDLVAASDGLITQVVVVSGEAVVRDRETVARGDVLIRGEASPTGRARGVVRAHVWYQGYGEGGATAAVDTPTGRSSTRVLLKAGSFEIILRGSRPDNYEYALVEETRRRIPDWRNQRALVEVITERTIEVSRQITHPGWEQAEREAAARALAAAFVHVSPEARVVDTSSQIVQVGSDRVGVRVVVKTSEDIGRFVPADTAFDRE